MKFARRKLFGRLILLLILLPLGITMGMIYRAVQRQGRDQALIAATRQNDTRTVISLLAKGADPNAEELPPYMGRLWEGLRDRRSHPGDLPTALVIASNLDVENIPLMTALLDAGARPAVPNQYGKTPLMLAALHSRPQTVRLLLDHGAAINAQRPDGYTALHCAAGENDVAVVQLLLSRGALVNARALDGKTPLHIAAGSGHTASLLLMLQSGGDLNAHDAHGKTPLTIAAEGDQADCVRLLLARGAPMDSRDDAGLTALTAAKRCRNPQIVKILTQAGAP